jgi:septin family protein
MCGYLRLEQQRFAKQERNTSTPRDELIDGRVDVILYFLPINARIREMDLDTTVINAIAAYAPVIPVMTRVRPWPLPTLYTASPSPY